MCVSVCVWWGQLWVVIVVIFFWFRMSMFAVDCHEGLYWLICLLGLCWGLGWHQQGCFKCIEMCACTGTWFYLTGTSNPSHPAVVWFLSGSVVSAIQLFQTLLHTQPMSAATHCRFQGLLETWDKLSLYEVKKRILIHSWHAHVNATITRAAFIWFCDSLIEAVTLPSRLVSDLQQVYSAQCSSSRLKLLNLKVGISRICKEWALGFLRFPQWNTNSTNAMEERSQKWEESLEERIADHQFRALFCKINVDLGLK